MTYSTRFAHCPICDSDVSIHWWASDVDPGDSGWVRDCLHGDYVTN